MVRMDGGKRRAKADANDATGTGDETAGAVGSSGSTATVVGRLPQTGTRRRLGRERMEGMVDDARVPGGRSETEFRRGRRDAGSPWVEGRMAGKRLN